MKKNKKIFQHVVSLCFGMAMGLGIGVVMGKYMKEISASQLAIPELLILLGIFLLGLAVVISLQTVLHEFGHLIFGYLTGYRFSSFRVGSMMWIRENGKLRCKRLSIAGTGGQCLMNPPDMVDGKIPVVLYNLGGSLMNLAVGILFLVLAFIGDDVPIFSVFCWLMVFTGFAEALLNGIPMRLGMIDNDGHNAWTLRKNSEARRSFWIQTKVNAQIGQGVRIKDMPAEWFEMPSEEGLKNSMTVVLAVFAYERLMDERKFPEAKAVMEKLLHGNTAMVDLHRNMMICDLVYCELIGDHSKEKIEKLLTDQQKKFMRSMRNFPSVLRTEYAYALLEEGDIKKADKIKEQFEKCASTYPYPSDIESERELIDIATGLRNGCDMGI